MNNRPSRKMRFTQANVRKLKSSDRRGTRYTDTLVPGFGVTVYPDQRKVFFLRYGSRNRRRFLTLGTFGSLTVDDARDQAQDVLAGYRLRGKDPALELKRSREVPTFSGWVETYLPRRQRARPKSAARDEAYLKEARRSFGGRALDEITPNHVEKAREKIADSRGDVTSNRWLSAVRACFKMAIASGVVDHDPTQFVELYDERPGRRRPRVLDDAELRAIVYEVDRLTNPFFRAVFLLLIATGARKSEALGARWEDVNLDVGEWRLPNTKSGNEQLVFLAPPVVELLESLPRIEGSPWVFPSIKKPRRRHLVAIDPTWRALRKRAGVGDVWIHDLRRSFGDRIKRAGDLQMASEALRHAHITTTAEHYAPAGEARIRDTLARVVGEVIPFPKTKNSGSNRTTAQSGNKGEADGKSTGSRKS